MKSTNRVNGPQTQIRSSALRAHITQRGNYRQPVFFTDEDRNQFLTLLNGHADDRRVLVHGHTLMSNHVHLVVTGEVDPISWTKNQQSLDGAAG